MKFGSMTDSDIGKNSLNFGDQPDCDSEIRKKYVQFQEHNLLFQEHNLLVMWPLDDASGQSQSVRT